MKTNYLLALGALASAALLSGCVTKEYVQEQIQAVTGQVKALEGRTDSALKAQADGQASTGKSIAEVQVTLKVHADRIARNEAEIAQLSRTAQDAVERANAAGRMAQGKLVYEVAFSDDKLRFAPSKAVLGKEAMAALDDFAARLKAENKSVYIEIQGHTDSIGEAGPNQKLGEERAEAVRRYLSMKGGLPLHRMSTISYGETAPVADNKVRAGRQQNRRVVLVVIQ